MGRRGWPIAGGISPAGLVPYLPQWIAAGAWEPKSNNTYLNTVPLEFTAAEDIVFTSIKYDSGSNDEWFFTTIPPIGWTSSKIKFIPHYIVIDSLGTPQTMIFELGAEFILDQFLPDVTTAWQVITSTKTAGIATVPQYIIGTESAELTLTGTPTDSGAIGMRMKRGADAESDPLYFVGAKLMFI